LTLRLAYDVIEKNARYTAAPVVRMNRKVVDIYRSRQEPIKNVTNYLSVGLGKNRAGAGDLQLLAKKTAAPGEAVRCSFDRHYLIEVGIRHGSKAQTLDKRKRATGFLLTLWLFGRVGFSLYVVADRCATLLGITL
jgi:hypothetical protein